MRKFLVTVGMNLGSAMGWVGGVSFGVSVSEHRGILWLGLSFGASLAGFVWFGLANHQSGFEDGQRWFR